MKVFIIMQSEGKGISRVREVYIKKQDAEDFIETPQQPTIECNDCGQQKPNPKYYDSHNEALKRKLFILERTVEE